MGYHTKQSPALEQTFLERICNALDYSPRDLAKALGITYKDIEPLLAPLNTTADLNKEDVWWLIAAFTDRRIAEHLAVKAELNKALEKQRVKQAGRIAALKQRSPTPLPPRRPPLRR